MKIKSDYILREVAETYIVLPTGDAVVDFNGVISLNESGVLLWRLLEQGAELNNLVEALTSEYNVSAEEALTDVNTFLEEIRKVGCLEE